VVIFCQWLLVLKGSTKALSLFRFASPTKTSHDDLKKQSSVIDFIKAKEAQQQSITVAKINSIQLPMPPPAVLK